MLPECLFTGEITKHLCKQFKASLDVLRD